MIETLSAVFPCAPSKAPLTPHGFRDARPGPAEDHWPLAGVPCGEATGFDVLDIDPAGMAWLAAASLPRTFTQQTPRGIHFYFLHAPGLRNTKLSPGVDIKTTGGYVILWSREGYWYDDVPLAPWPSWLLELARKPKAERKIEPQKITCASLAGVGNLKLTPTQLNNIKSIQRVVELARPGNRNNALFWAACRFAEYAAANLIRCEIAEQLLFSSAQICGLVRDDGERAVRATIISGLSPQLKHIGQSNGYDLR